MYDEMVMIFMSIRLKVNSQLSIGQLDCVPM